MKSLNVVILNMEMGNIFSVSLACERVGLRAKLSSSPQDIQQADGLIIPGVGAFGTAMEFLKKNNLIDHILKFADEGRPIMGICLGMQLLLTRSEEFGDHKGLNIIKGSVLKLPDLDREGRVLRTPLISWREIQQCFNQDELRAGFLKDLSPKEYMYFVHSYFCSVDDPVVVSAKTTYGGFDYPAVIINKNVVGFQFHPEKSSKQGLHIYKNWAKYVENNSLGK